MWRFYGMLMASLLPPAICAAADGIRTDVAFKVPFAVDGKLTINRAELSVDDAGRTTLTVHYVKGQDIEVATYRVIRQDGPDPDPEPDPDPDPDPDPPCELWGIVVEESGRRTAQEAIVLADPGVRGLFADKRFRVIDRDEASAALKSYADRAKGMDLPALFLVSAAGKVHFEGPLPSTAAAAKALILKYKEGGGP